MACFGSEKMSNLLESLQYTRGAFKVLDQLLLPHETKYVDVLSVEDAWKVIRSMQVRGAPLIAITAALGLAVEANSCVSTNKFTTVDDAKAWLLSSMEYLRSSRPTAVNLFLAMDELTALVTSYASEGKNTPKELLLQVVEASERIWEADLATNRSIGYHGAQHILQTVKRDRIRVLTICNTGSLATAGYGTALGVVRALNDLGKLEHVFACETRPYNQGARLTAFEIVADQLPGTLITDSMASALMAKGIDVVIVGADRVAGNGDVANKIGTYQLAISAKYHGIPFFAAVPTTSLDMSMASGAEIHVEERPADELTSIFGQRIAPVGISVWNPAFDVTPCCLISGLITELGVILPSTADPRGMSQNTDPVIPVAEFLLQHSNADTLVARAKQAVTPVSTPIGYRRMDLQTMREYILTNTSFHKHLGLNLDPQELKDELQVDEIGDGNLNFVYIIRFRDQAVVVKQALPYVRCIGEGWPLTLQRAEFEYNALLEERALSPYVPEVYHYDRTHALLVMQYIPPPHLILRKVHMASQRIDCTVFRTKAAKWSNAAMCALSEKVIFTDPYTNSPLNRFTAGTEGYALSIRTDAVLKQAVVHFKKLFLTKAEALLHGDFHTGSIMVCEGSTFAIDPEFAFYGPMGFDIGAVLSNFYLAYFAHLGDAYGDWLLEQVQGIWTAFSARFTALWADAKGEIYAAASAEDVQVGLQGYLADIWRDAMGFTAMKMIRRIVGVSHVADLESIEDPVLRSLAEKRALLLARRLAVAAHANRLEELGMGCVADLHEKHVKPLSVATPAEEWAVN